MANGGALRIVLAIGLAAPCVCAQDRAAEPRDYELYGSIEQTSVYLSGRGLPDLYTACTEYVRSSGLEPIDEVSVEGRHFVRRTGYFDRGQVCGLLALNARPPETSAPVSYEAPILTGVIGGVPFRLWEPRDEALEAAREILPRAVGDLPIAEVIVDGAHHAHAGAWSIEEVVALIERQLVPEPPLDRVAGIA